MLFKILASFDQSVNFYISLDACNYEFSVGIENLPYKKKLLNYDFGTEEFITLADVIRLTFKIDDLKTEKMFLLNAGVSLCVDNKQSCLFTLNLMKDILLPKPLCNLETKITLSIGKALDAMPEYVSDLFIEAAGVKQYMEDPSCSRSSAPYSPSTDGWNKAVAVPRTLLQQMAGIKVSTLREKIHPVTGVIPYSPSTDGWNKECPLDLKLPKIPNNIPVTCHIPDYCTGVKRSAKLGNIMFLDFLVIDLQAEKKIIFSMNASVCLEAGKVCDITLEIVKDMYLPKIACDWSSSINSFSVSNFLAKQGLSLQSPLTDIVVKQILERLGIAEYLQDPQCDISNKMYQSQPGDLVGWRDECPGGLGNLKALSPLSIATSKGHIASRCTYIDFCLYIPLLRRSFHAYFDLNMCERSFKIGIEKLVLDSDFSTYIWGQRDTIDLIDVFIVDFLVDYNENAKYFRVDLNISIYLDRSQQYVTFEVFEGQVLPISACHYDTSYGVPGFSLNSWYAYHNIPKGSLLNPVMASKLLEYLKIGELMSPTQCQPSGAKYSPSVGGWKDACPLDVTMATLHKSSVGSIAEACTAVDLCSDVDFLGRPFHIYIDLDPCTNIGKIGVEEFSLKLDLTDATIFGN
ncbi:unnamed protein product [Mytilus edulis]|uniref:Uncharacterized protein n=1 Tax=Mytilus edulis TaxID=6550 RepID=A0A8S3TI85_MYTED|nr:unnamed protein product [Mytilus edulis]